MSAADLKPPVLLLAMPQVVDPVFHQSVVLLLAHEDEGSFGFIVNRETKVMVADVLRGLEIPWHGEASKRTYLGGPVQPQLGTVLFGAAQAAGETGETSGTRVVPGISITQQLSDLTVLAAAPPAAFKLCLGYAGWGAGQLVSEILRNDWLTAPASPALVFADAPDQAWSAALHSVGIDPATLPAWTSAADEGTAN